MKITVYLLSALIALLHLPAQACSRAYMYTPFTGFHDAQFVFYGEVTAHISKRECHYILRPDIPCENVVHGMRLRILESVHLPEPASREVDLYPLGGPDAGCRRSGVPDPSVLASYPIGLRVAVAAPMRFANVRTDPVIAKMLRDGPIELVVDASEIGQSIVPLAPDADLSKLHRYVESYEPVMTGWTYSGALSFELHKDAVRLSQEATPQARYQIIERMARGWRPAQFMSGNIDDSAYEKTVRKYVPDQAAARVLLDIRADILYRANMMAPPRLSAYINRQAELGNPEFQLYWGITRLGTKDYAESAQWLKRVEGTFPVPATYGMALAHMQRADDLRGRDLPNAASREQKLADAAFQHAAHTALRLARQGDPWALYIVAVRPPALQAWLGKNATKADPAAEICSAAQKIPMLYASLLGISSMQSCGHSGRK